MRHPLAWLMIPVLMTGCQAYEPVPLMLSDYPQQMALRQVHDPGVLAYAQRSADQGHDPHDTMAWLSLPHAEAVMLYFNATLREARLAAGVPEARARHAGLWDDPTIAFDLLRTLESAAHPWKGAIWLGVTIPLSGRLEVARSLAEAQARQAWMQAAVLETQMLNRLREQWLSWSATMLRIALLEQQLHQQQTLLAAAGHLEASGELRRTQWRLLEMSVQRLAMHLAEQRHVADIGKAQLFTSLGLLPDVDIALKPIPLAWPVTTAKTTPLESLLTHPLMEVARAGYDVAEEKLRQEITRQFPDLEIGPAIEREEGQSKIGLGGGMVVPVWNRNRGAIAQALVERDMARVQAQATYEALVADFVQTQGRVAVAHMRLEKLLTGMMPLADAQLAELQQLSERGEADLMLLHSAWMQMDELQLQVIDARLQLAQANLDYTSLLDPQWLNPSMHANAEAVP